MAKTTSKKLTVKQIDDVRRRIEFLLLSDPVDFDAIDELAAPVWATLAKHPNPKVALLAHRSPPSSPAPAR